MDCVTDDMRKNGVSAEMTADSKEWEKKTRTGVWWWCQKAPVSPPHSQSGTELKKYLHFYKNTYILTTFF